MYTTYFTDDGNVEYDKSSLVHDITDDNDDTKQSKTTVF